MLPNTKHYVTNICVEQIVFICPASFGKRTLTCKYLFCLIQQSSVSEMLMSFFLHLPTLTRNQAIAVVLLTNPAVKDRVYLTV